MCVHPSHTNGGRFALEETSTGSFPTSQGNRVKDFRVR